VQTSDRGLEFIIREEGEVLKAYRCPAGVWTIGSGLTKGSGVIAPKAGMTITHEENVRLVKLALAKKYEPAMSGLNNHATPQAVWDGAASMIYNCGPGATKWKWYDALLDGNAGKSAKLLLTTAITANGRKLLGLVNRRKREAKLIATGVYGNTPILSKPGDYSGVAEKLKYLGFPDVAAFQKANGLTPDGIPGSATRATLQRAFDGKKAKTVTVSSGAGSGTVAGTTNVAADPSAHYGTIAEQALYWGLGTAIVVGLAYLVWRYRGPLFAWLPEGVKDFFQFKLGVTIGRRVAT